VNGHCASGARARPAGRWRTCARPPPPFEVRMQRRYNPEGLTRYNIVPGLMGVILTMTMVMMTSLAMTRERERGTMENLLATPVRPLEVMAGKIVPYILIGYVQVGVILVRRGCCSTCRWWAAWRCCRPCWCCSSRPTWRSASLFSTLARNQLQAMQMTFFFFLPSMLLSGFMFPFRGMPGWAQAIGEALPLTHFLRVVRGILLKGLTLSRDVRLGITMLGRLRPEQGNRGLLI
jgi:ABC-2 type transport system permease protein